jgi:hypothetical protein
MSLMWVNRVGLTMSEPLPLYPLMTDLRQKDRHVRFVPISD